MLDASAAANSSALNVSDYRNCILSIAGSAGANLKVFIKGALGQGEVGQTAPAFDVVSGARSTTNDWDYVEIVDLEDGAAIDGDVGVDLNGNIIRLIEVNINSLDWLAVEVTQVTAGVATVRAVCTTNQ